MSYKEEVENYMVVDWVWDLPEYDEERDNDLANIADAMNDDI